MSLWWQYASLLMQAIFSLAGLALLFSIARRLGAWEEWRKSVDEQRILVGDQIKSLGKMVQEYGIKLGEIIGRLSK